MSEPVLLELLPLYLHNPPSVSQLDPALKAAGLAWATERVQATSALLTHEAHGEADGYAAFNYLLDQLQAAPDPPPIPVQLWDRLLVEAQPDDALRIGAAAYFAQQQLISERAFHLAADAGDHNAEAHLGVLLQDQGKLEEAERWLRRAADAGQDDVEYYHHLEYHLGLLLHQTGRTEEAERWYQRAADGGDHSAECNLGRLLQDQGKVDEAEQWLRRAATAKDHHAESSLGMLYHHQGKLEEAEQWFRRAADANDHHAAYHVGLLLHDMGRTEEAEQWFRRAANAGHSDTTKRLRSSGR